MNILILYPGETLAAGGVNKTIREIAKNMSEKGSKVTILQLNSLNLPKEEYYDGYTIIRIPSKLSNYFYDFSPEIYFYLKNNLDKLNPDIIHIHGYHNLFSPFMLLIFKLLKIETSLIFTPHYDPLNHSTITGKLFGGVYDKTLGKFILKKFDHIISISNFEADNIKKISEISEITVIPHGSDYINIEKKEKKDYLNLLYVGYLLDYKGVQYILKAINNLIYFKNVKNVKLTVVGEGNYKKKLFKLANEINVTEFIEWKNFLSHEKILEEMKESDILLLLSKTEGYGIVVAEALSVGTPTIVTNGTALEEFTKENGCFGVEYPPRPDEVAELIINVYKNDVKVGPFSKKIRTWDKVVNDYEKVYKMFIK